MNWRQIAIESITKLDMLDKLVIMSINKVAAKKAMGNGLKIDGILLEGGEDEFFVK